MVEVLKLVLLIPGKTTEFVNKNTLIKDYQFPASQKFLDRGFLGDGK